MTVVYFFVFIALREVGNAIGLPSVAHRIIVNCTDAI